MRYAGTIANTLGDGASGGIMCTLGGGAHIGDGVGFNAGASTLGGGACMGGGVDLSAGAVGGVGGFVNKKTTLNRSASWCIFQRK